jgi:hypothetical protein
MGKYKPNPNKERKTTPKKFTHAASQKNAEKSGKYPNYSATKYRDGTNEVTDNSANSEFSIWQHRSGTSVEMQSDGSLHVQVSNSHYTMVFGENRVTVTGAQDLHVKGDGSLRVYGDYNKTVHGNVNYTATGDFNVTSQNLNRTIRGNIDTQAKNKTDKIEGSVSVQAHGAIAHVADGSVTTASLSDQVHVGGAKGANFSVTKEGTMAFNNEKGDVKTGVKGGSFHLDAEKEIAVASGKATSFKSGDKMEVSSQLAMNFETKSGDMSHKSGGNLNQDATQIWHNSGKSSSASPTLPQKGSGTATAAATTSGEGPASSANKSLA